MSQEPNLPLIESKNGSETDIEKTLSEKVMEWRHILMFEEDEKKKTSARIKLLFFLARKSRQEISDSLGLSYSVVYYHTRPDNPREFRTDTIREMLKDGKTTREVSEILGITYQAAWYHAKKLKDANSQKA